MKRTGIPRKYLPWLRVLLNLIARTTVSLAREANNHFGIECHDDWTGPKFTHTDNKRNECFRKYSRAEESFLWPFWFSKICIALYSFLFSLNSTDYKAWAHGLKKAGYATNPDYPNMFDQDYWRKQPRGILDHGYRCHPACRQISTILWKSML